MATPGASSRARPLPGAAGLSLLAARGLTKRFGGLVAVDGLELNVGAGEIRGLIGPNGSGKTTTINVLSGLYRADAGEAPPGGERIDRLRPHQIAARGVARTFQIAKLWGNMTVLENVLVPALAEHERGAGRPTAEILEGARRRRGWGGLHSRPRERAVAGRGQPRAGVRPPDRRDPRARPAAPGVRGPRPSEARARQGAVRRPGHAPADRAWAHGASDPPLPDGRAVRRRAPHHQGHDHGDDRDDEPRGGGDLPDRLARDGDTPPPLP